MVRLPTILVAIALVAIPVSPTPWNDPSTNQFHIQTDEGPERYFKYQTQNGQYRKEKRLEDGTVIGSYAWIDDDGYLRQRDYIADSQGYRIVKNKNIFVGRNVNVGDAVKATKKITNSYIPPKVSVTTASPTVEVSLNSIPSSTQTPYKYQPGGVGVSTEGHFQSSTPRPFTSTTTVSVSSPTGSYIPPKSHTESPVYYSPTPDTELSPPSFGTSTPRPITYIPPVSNPSTIYLPSSTPSTIYLPSSTPEYINITPPPRKYIPQSPINTNSIEYSSNPQYEHYPEDFTNPYIHQNGPTYPIDTRGQSFNPVYNKIGNGYDPQYPYYDGISVTNDGFRYYIPKAYHEEQQVTSNTKSGSFGYVDPFGIRRVIYYNAGPDGFKHRKNNRYVGFDATPYDPRPY